MKQLTFIIDNQELTRTDNLEIVSDAIGQFEAIFTFDTWWNGYTPTVQFTKDGKTIDVILNNNKCIVPPEALQGGGIFYVNVFSTDGTGDRKTANEVAVPLKTSGYKKGGSHSQDPTPKVYEQILKDVDEAKKAAKVQSDMNENDETNPAFIKNRTHYKEEVEVDYLTLPYIEPIAELGLAPYGRKIGLELGKTYTIEVEHEGQVLTLTATTTELPKSVFGIEFPGVVFLYQQSLGLKILDGVDGDITENEIYLADNCYYNFYEDLQDYKIKIRDISGTDTITHKLPKEYYDIPEVDQVFNSESENAQSGIAVEQAIEEYDKSLMVSTEKIEDDSITFSKMQQLTEDVYVEYTGETFSRIEHNFGKVVTSCVVCLNGLDIDLTNCDADTIELTCKFGISTHTISINVADFVSDTTKSRLNIICACEVFGKSLNYGYEKVTIQVGGFFLNNRILYHKMSSIHKNSGIGYSEVYLYVSSNNKSLPMNPYNGILISSK